MPDPRRAFARSERASFSATLEFQRQNEADRILDWTCGRADDGPSNEGRRGRFAARVGRKMRREPRKLSLAQPEIIAIHQRSPFGDLESQKGRIGNPVYGAGA